MWNNTGIQPLEKEEAERALRMCSENIQAWLHCFTFQFKNAYSTNGFYHPVGNYEWTTGFWTGQLWMAYESTQDEKLKKAAEIQTADFYNRILTKHDVNHHDMGFLLIIDCLLNVPLLFWAAGESGEEEYARIARTHIGTALRNVVRPDFSTFHTFYFDPKTGKPDHGCTHQGYADDSVWARGQAWGVYGIALAYSLTKNQEYLAVWRRVTAYFLSKLPADAVPYWDMIFTDGSDEPRDSSAGAIAVCGILEMLRHPELPEKEFYRETAARLLGALARNYAVCSPAESNGLLRHSTYCKSSPYNTCPNMGVDECCAWGDYFYMEALMRFTYPAWKAYW